MPPILHRKAEIGWYRRTRWQIQEAFRYEQIIFYIVIVEAALSAAFLTVIPKRRLFFNSWGKLWFRKLICQSIIKVWSTFSKVVGVGKAHKYFSLMQWCDLFVLKLTNKKIYIFDDCICNWIAQFCIDSKFHICYYFYCILRSI